MSSGGKKTNSASVEEDSAALDYCRLRSFADTGGDQPVNALICDEDFPITYRERACLKACTAHWDYSKGKLGGSVLTKNKNQSLCLLF